MSSPPSPSTSETFPIVAVGCSAGGLTAVLDLVRHLPSEPGFTVVLIQHLDRSHPSELVSILAGVSPLPVRAIEDGLRVEVNQIYVAPPNAAVSLQQGLLHLAELGHARGERRPIDGFFKSLAATCGSRAVGVVLSGSGSDGSEGVQSLRAAGGAALAQDASAQFRGMPDSAIATGCVDAVLAPAAIARELCRRAGRDVDEEAAPASPAPASSSRPLLPLQARRLFDPPSRFAALRAHVFPRLIADRQPPTALRVWVPGCSTGEEVYSLAICLLEYLSARTRPDLTLQIFGTEVDSAALERARGGLYSTEIERYVSRERLHRFFVRAGSMYKIHGDVRNLCVFAPHDPANHPPLSKMDLISCPQLFDELEPAARERLQSVFAYALRPSGFLIVGASELVPPAAGFAAIAAEAHIYQRIVGAVPRFEFQVPHCQPIPSSSGLGTPSADAAFARVQRAADRLLLARIAPPAVVISEDGSIVEFRGDTRRYLEIAPGLASLDVLHMVREELREPLRNALAEARAKEAPVRRQGIRMAGKQPRRLAAIHVAPFRVAAEARLYFLVTFEDPPDEPRTAPDSRAASKTSAAAGAAVPSRSLDEDLARAHQSLQALMTELQSSNEELLTANEEASIRAAQLHDANDQLRTALEELQTVNEELLTVNEETSLRREEAARARDDLSNVLNSVDIPIVLLGPDTRIRRVPSAAAQMFGFSPQDMGRPLSDLSSPLAAAAAELAPEVLEHLQPLQRTLQDAAGHWYQIRVRPYVAEGRRIDGTVVAFVSVDEVQRASQRLADYQEKLQRMAFDAALTEERERRRLAADLHDRIGQALAVAQIKLKSARQAGGTRPAIDEALELLAQSSDDMRSLVFDLSPPILYDLGLGHALSWLAEDLDKRWGLQIAVHDAGQEHPLDDATAALAFRAVRELLTNVLKHAQAPAAEISLQRKDGQLEVSVQDRGVGFNLTSLEGPHANGGFGLFSVREQIARLGGSVEVNSALGKGTQVTLRLPLGREPARAEEASVDGAAGQVPARA